MHNKFLESIGVNGIDLKKIPGRTSPAYTSSQHDHQKYLFLDKRRYYSIPFVINGRTNKDHRGICTMHHHLSAERSLG